MEVLPSEHAAVQYATTTANLSARIALHTHSADPQSWYAWLGERLPPTQSLLEVGAGTGALWTALGRPGGGLTLTDSSAAMCAQLRAAVPDARVLRCDATRLPFRDASFDTLVANHMLYHLDDAEAGLREFARVLRPGGRLLAATNGADHLVELSALGTAVGRPDLRIGARLNGFRAENGPALVARHFTGVQAERRHGDLAVPESGPVVAFLDSLSDQPLTPTQREMVEALVQAEISADGHFRIRRHTVLITATRPGVVRGRARVTQP